MDIFVLFRWMAVLEGIPFTLQSCSNISLAPRPTQSLKTNKNPSNILSSLETLAFCLLPNYSGSPLGREMQFWESLRDYRRSARVAPSMAISLREVFFLEVGVIARNPGF